MIVFRKRLYNSDDRPFWSMEKVFCGDRRYVYEDEDDDVGHDQDGYPMPYGVHKRAWLVGKVGDMPGHYPFSPADFEPTQDDEVEIEDD